MMNDESRVCGGGVASINVDLDPQAFDVFAFWGQSEYDEKNDKKAILRDKYGE